MQNSISHTKHLIEVQTALNDRDNGDLREGGIIRHGKLLAAVIITPKVSKFHLKGLVPYRYTLTCQKCSYHINCTCCKCAIYGQIIKSGQ